MGIYKQVILLHIRQKERVSRGKAVVCTHSVNRIGGLCTRQSRHGYIQPVRQVPLTGSFVLDNHMVVKRFEIIDQVGAVIPFAEIQCRNGVTAVHCGMTHFGGIERYQQPCYQ